MYFKNMRIKNTPALYFANQKCNYVVFEWKILEEGFNFSVNFKYHNYFFEHQLNSKKF